MALPKTPNKTTSSFAFVGVRRALLNGIVVRRFDKPEMRKVISFFDRGRTCIFCGDKPIRRWDHLVAIKNGGDTVLGNMVPACARCDDSKGASGYREWALGDAKYSPKTRGVSDIAERLVAIDKYVEKYGYSPQLPKDRLNADEFQELKRLRADSRRLRKEFDTFFAQYHKRIGGK